MERSWAFPGKAEDGGVNWPLHREKDASWKPALQNGHDISCPYKKAKRAPIGGLAFPGKAKLRRSREGRSYGETCLGKAWTPEGENSKRICHSLGALRPDTSGELNSQRRTAFRATSAKYLLGPGSVKSASETLPEALTWARMLTRTLPVIVARALSGTS